MMLVRTLQLQLHVAIFQTVMPSNAVAFIKEMMIVVKFDVLGYWEW